jgi:branched-chain amino acid transport system ATP-binding protein
MTAALEIAGLRVEREAGPLLDIGELTLEAGTLAVIVGEADSGKTLLAGVLSGHTAASAGSVRVAGRKLVGSPSARRRLGLAATVADGNRIAGCTVAEALALAGASRAEDALDRLPLLGARRGLRSELLSGGEQHLLQVACAWCSRPRTLVLDAPTTGLAADAASAVHSLAREAAADGAAVVWLDQAAATAPEAASWRLDSGVLSRAPAAG